MSQGGYMTLVGFVAQDPRQRETKNGTWVTDLRVGTTPRIQDRVTSQWRDGETSYYNVACWRRLGDHVRASLRKGDPVMVKGRCRSRSYTDKNGVQHNVVDIIADTVGHDLNRGVANYLRQDRRSAVVAEELAAGHIPDMPEDADMIDDEEIEQFGQALESLPEAALAPHALEEGDETDNTVPFESTVPSAPF